jgi:hypothetical protein
MANDGLEESKPKLKNKIKRETERKKRKFQSIKT